MPTKSKASSSSKTKTSKPAVISKNPKSAEFIKNSDNEDEEEHMRTPQKLEKNPNTTESKPKPPENNLKAVSISVEPTPDGKASTREERDGRSSPIILSSRSRSEVEESGMEKDKVRKAGGDEHSEDEESSDGSSTGSESGTDSSTDSTSRDDNGKSYKGVARSKETSPTKPQKQTTSQKPVPQYELPSGFGPATITIPSSSMLTDLFSSDSVRTKQLWHIIVPSSVPVDSLREISSQSIQSGSAILTHDGADYGLISEVQDQSAKKTLLLPYAEANEYKSIEVRLSKTLSLQQLIPDRRHGSSSIKAGFTNVKSKYAKPVRQQPEGLKMRYHPFGDTEDSSERNGFESSSKQSMRAPQFRKPISIELSLSSKNNMSHEESGVEMEADAESAIKKRKRRRHTESLPADESSHTGLQRDSTASPKVSEKRKNPPESERGSTERLVKKHKRNVPLESVPDARISPLSSKAVHSEASEASKGSKMQKKRTNAERNGIETSKNSQKHKTPSELVVAAETRLIGEKPDGMRNPIKANPSVEPVSRNGHPEDEIMLDPPLSIPPNSKNEAPSYQGERPTARPDVVSVRKEIKREDEIIAEPVKTKQKAKRERRHRERSEGEENRFAGEATRSVTEAAKEATTTKPAADTLTDTPTTTTKPENTMTAEELGRQRKNKKHRRHERAERSNSIIPPEQMTANNHPLGIANTKPTATTSATPATIIPNAIAPTQTSKPTAAAPPPSSSPAAAISHEEVTSKPEHPDAVATQERKKIRKRRAKSRKDGGG